MGAHSSLPAGETAANFLAQPGYATPKIDVRGAVVRDGEILLVRERSDGLWCLPGGWADVGDLPSAMVVREVKEESGFDVVPRKVIGVFDANRTGRPMEFYHAFKIIFLCTLIGGEPRVSHETMAVDFFDLNDLPPLSLYRTDESMLREVFAHIQDPNRRTAFD